MKAVVRLLSEGLSIPGYRFIPRYRRVFERLDMQVGLASLR